MSLKSKGINAERDLIHKFWSKNVPAVRVAGSGSSKYPSPDIVAGTRSKRFAIECKLTKEDKKYIEKKDIEDLRVYSELFGAKPLIAIKFRKNDWLFLSLEDLEKKEKNYLIKKENAKLKGMLFEEIL